MQRARQLSFTIAIAAVVLVSGCSRSGGPAPVIAYGQQGGAGSTGIHTVLGGDTVGGIADRYRLVLRDILVVNRLEAPYILQPGQRLKLPAPREYRVRRRDTVAIVARLFNTSPSQLVRLNNLTAPYALKQGQVLKLPVVEDQSAIMQTAVSAAPTNEVTRPPPVSPGGIEREELPPPVVMGESVPAPPPQVAKASLESRVPDTTPPRAGAKFMKPVEGPVLSSYGPKSGGLHNDGINIKAPKGAPVRAAENGVVVYAGDMKGYGTMVLVRHADRWITAYAHLDKILAERGATVQRGQTIATVGSSGSADQPQLHFEIRRGTDALNPEKYM